MQSAPKPPAGLLLSLALLIVALISPTAVSALPPDDVSHVIVTTDTLAPELQRLADHWTAAGTPATVVTLSWIQSEVPPGVDLAATVREFLRLAHDEWGLHSVLLGGNGDLVPVRFAWSDFMGGEGTLLDTDLYYACLDGVWDSDGDGLYAEAEDDADLSPELAVGRAPISTPQEATVFVDKTLAYRAAAAGGAPDALVLAEVLFPASWNPGDPISLDGAVFGEDYAALIASAEPPVAATRLYENHGDYPDALPLTESSTLAALSGGDHRLVHFTGHGHLDAMSVGDGHIDAADVATLTNSVPFCLMALFPSSAEIHRNCLLEELLRHPDGGAALALGASDQVFSSSTHVFHQQLYAEFAAEPGAGAGEVLRRTLEFLAPEPDAGEVWRWQQLTVNLLGDPLLPMGAGTTTGVSPVATPAGLELHPAVPNPFNPTVSIRFRLDDAGVGPRHTIVRITDLRGRVLATLLDAVLAPDLHEVAWDGRAENGEAMPSGIYLVSVQAGDRRVGGKLTLLK